MSKLPVEGFNMCESTRYSALLSLLVAIALVSTSAQAADELNSGGLRYEFAIGFHELTGVSELRPASQGEFNEAGFNAGGAVHWPGRRANNQKLQIGVDYGFFSNDSNITFITDDLISRGLYLVPSLKWKPGSSERFSLNAGFGFYLVDIAEVSGEYPWLTETEVWQESGVGGFFGGTWDFASEGGPTDRGLTVSFKVHFFDLGTVRDEDSGLPVSLGADAGKLDRGMYQLQLGYRWE